MHWKLKRTFVNLASLLAIARAAQFTLQMAEDLGKIENLSLDQSTVNSQQACDTNPDMSNGEEAVNLASRPSLTTTTESADPKGGEGNETHVTEEPICTASAENEDCGSLWTTNNIPVVSAIDRFNDRGEIPYRNAVFRSSHNSYSGGSRRSIEEQLNAGVRFIEFDIHAAGFADNGDFRLGHNAPGLEVSHDGTNPKSILLSDWLRLVEQWSARNPTHAPITLGLDMKDNLSDVREAAHGNVGALNEIIVNVLGTKLVRPSQFETKGRLGQGPTVNQLRGRILVVLSGDLDSRLFYRWDVGARPAVAMNSLGWIVEVHDSGIGRLGSMFSRFQNLWYWTGRRTTDGHITWLRHGKYDSGVDPAVTINDNNDIVEVHKSGSRDTLWCRYGKLGDNGDIRWSPPVKYDAGIQPTVRFADLGSSDLREIHASQQHPNEFWDWRGKIDFHTGSVTWGAHGRTSDSPYSKESTEAGAVSLTVSAASSSSAVPVPGTLRYSTSDGRQGRIRHEQFAFVEFQQNNNPALVDDGTFFHANRASAREWVTLQRHAGFSVRQWGFNNLEYAINPPANFPATDNPFEKWYLDYTDSIGAIE